MPSGVEFAGGAGGAGGEEALPPDVELASVWFPAAAVAFVVTFVELVLSVELVLFVELLAFPVLAFCPVAAPAVIVSSVVLTPVFALTALQSLSATEVFSPEVSLDEAPDVTFDEAFEVSFDSLLAIFTLKASPMKAAALTTSSNACCGCILCEWISFPAECFPATGKVKIS